ncbi:MAG: hypothetical protein K6F92_03160 [Lachnospiraceae bacterium]|nr:hypothetical protein [Lachnospiraceae bacterium]
MSDSKILKVLVGGAVVGACAAAYVAYKKQCESFSAELDDEFEEVDSEETETAERSYSEISLDDVQAETVTE